MKKILFIHHNGDDRGGAEKSFAELITNLSREKYTVAALMPEGRLASRLKSKNVNVYTVGTIAPLKNPTTIIDLFTLISKIIQTAFSIALIIRKEKADIIYANTKTACIYGVLPAVLLRKKIIWHERDIRRHPATDRYLAAFVDKIIAISDTVYNSLISDRDICKRKTKIVRIYNGIILNDYRGIHKRMKNKINLQTEEKRDIKDLTGAKIEGAASDLPEGLNIPSEKLPLPDTSVFLIPAQFVEWKKQDTVLRAVPIILNAHKNILFIFCGKITDKSYMERLKTLAAELNITQHVVFSDYIYDISGMLNMASAVILPSVNEPFGRAAVEAMAASKPVIAVKNGGPAEIITNNREGFLIPPDDYIAMASAAMKLIEDRELALSLGANGYNTAKHYSISKMIGEIENILN